MRDRRGERFSSALFRMLAGHPGFAAAALLDLRGSAPRLVAATPDLLALRRRDAGDWPVPTPAVGAPVRVDPAPLGLEARFVAAATVPAPDGEAAGCLLVAHRDERRLTPGTARALADAAELAAPLLPRAPSRPAASAEGAATLHGAVRSRAAAERLIAAALRRQSAGPVGLMVVDLDRFRSVNTALGSAAGDALLAVTGARLQAAIGPGSFLLRLEGDRFVVVAAGDQRAQAALAQRLLAAVSQPLALNGRTLAIQASIGVVAGVAAGVPPSDLLVHADAALRRAKADGRDRFALHEPALVAATLDGSRLELDLAGALRDRQMHLVYQPFVDLADGRIAGFETLLRWRHPLRGELNPTAFIAAAEVSGQILPLGDWVLRTALAAAAAWPQRLALAVNISPLQFHQPGFLAGVDAALAESGLEPERLELEITETVLMRDNPETTAVLHALIDRGVRIALDDFGTGYSALAYLARLPHHRIKLDKAFVQDLANPATRDLIRAIITVARAQDVAVTAEGVESLDLLGLVRRTGFSHAQGYATGLPVAEPDGYFPTPVATPAE